MQFIKDYSEVKSFWTKLGKNIISEKQAAIDSHTKTLDTLMQQYRDRAVRDTQIGTRCVPQGLNLDGMAYTGGAGLNKTKKCLDGTRTEILPEIVSCFARDRQAERREEKIFTTIARGQAGRDPSFRRALADVPAKDHSLKTASGVEYDDWKCGRRAG